MTHVRRRHRRDLFAVAGQVDVATADDLFEILLPAVLSPCSDTVFLNMADVTLFDDSGVDALSDLREVAAARGKDIVLVAPSPSVRELIGRADRDRVLRQVAGDGARISYLRL